MKTHAHYWYDHYGGWDFEFGPKVDIPKEVVEDYKKTEVAYVKACGEVGKAVDQYLKGIKETKRARLQRITKELFVGDWSDSKVFAFCCVFSLFGAIWGALVMYVILRN